MRAEHNDGVTLWLLLAVMNDLLSLAGESRMSSMLSSVDSVLQQVDLTETISSNAAAKGCQLPGKCCNNVKNKASPHLIPMCEFVHTVKKKREVGKKQTHFTMTALLTLLFIYIVAQLTCGKC